MGVVGGAVKGIHTPLQIAWGLTAAALLSQNPNLRGFPLEEIEHRGLGGMVSLGDQIAASALFANVLKAAKALAELNSAQFGCAPGQFTEVQDFAAAEACAEGRLVTEGLAGQRGPHLLLVQGRPAFTWPRPKKRPN